MHGNGYNSTTPRTFEKRAGLLKEIYGGYGIQKRLSDMGLVRGNRIRVVKNDFGGPVIVSVGNLGEGRIVIGHGMALKIMVQQAVS